MPKFAANISMLFTEHAFLKRFKLASDSGFKYVEYLFPYEWDAFLLADHLKEHRLQQILFNLPPGNWQAGDRGIACIPNRQNEFRDGVAKAIEYANVLGVRQLNCLAGLNPEHIDNAKTWDTLTANILYAAQQLKQHQITLMIEPINSKVDMPGFYLDTLAKTKAIIDELQQTNIKIQFDIYHMQIMQGDILSTITQNITQIGHIQFADNPGRHEPGTGELNFTNIFNALDKLNYQGWVSAEYIPLTSTLSSLKWFNSSP
jgi:hydroxypyruvate isomerase